MFKWDLLYTAGKKIEKGQYVEAVKRPFLGIFPWFSRPKTSQKLGTIGGVFIPCILQMIGVILFMRLGWILGNIGLTSMLSIITVSSVIILITSFSMTSVVTNMKMGGGGSYFIISRSLGIEFGSAIGILLTISQVVSIALNVSGFSYSLHHEFFPFVPLLVIKILVICSLTAISYFSTSGAIKMQMVILSFIGIALCSVFFGGITPDLPMTAPAPVALMSLTVAFAMFFPATVGIEAGMALSGDLKNPERSLPIGTIASVIAGFILYSGMAIYLWNNIPRELLIDQPLILTKAARLGFGVILGIWGATISSAMGSILGAPRTTQALAEDRVLPKFLSKGHGEKNEPRVATIFIFFVALAVTVVSNINQLIPILTMVSLVTYTLINFVSFFESLVRNPSWRPTFRTPWYISLAGCFACGITMLIINPVASFLVLGMVIALVVWFSKKNLSGNWEDIRYSVLTYLVRMITYGLESLDKNARSWRPNILAIVDKDLSEKNLIRLANTLDQSQGLLTYGTTIPVNKDRSHPLKVTTQHFKQYFAKERIPCFVHVSPFEDPFLGILGMVKNYGIGSIRPNTILLRHSVQDSCPENLSTFLLSSYHMGKNVILLRDQSVEELTTFSVASKKKKIDIWWGGKYLRNFEFSLVLSHILQESKYWPQAEVQVKTLVGTEEDRVALKAKYEQYVSKMRMRHITFSVYVGSEGSVSDRFAEHSHDTNLSLVGLRPPFADEPSDEYSKYFLSVVESTKSFRNAAFVLVGEEIDFEKIFR